MRRGRDATAFAEVALAAALVPAARPAPRSPEAARAGARAAYDRDSLERSSDG
jgi:hypothetical protein